MKKVIPLLFSCLLGSSAAVAQDKLFIHSPDRQVAGASLLQIDSIGFSDNGTSTYLYMKDGLHELNTASIDSLTFGQDSQKIRIRYTGTSAEIENPLAYEGVSVTSAAAEVTVHATTDLEVEYILSGTATDGSFKIYSGKKFTLTLDGIDLTNSDGPAINIQSGKKVSVNLADGTINSLTDGKKYTTVEGEDMKATFFSEGQLIFSGEGTLDIRGNKKHGICSDDYIEIKSGNFILKNIASDGIHANDYIQIDGGNLEIEATGDGNTYTNTSGRKDSYSATCIKSDRNILLLDGKITTNSSGTAGKGISADGTLTIGDETHSPVIQVTTSGKKFLVSGSGQNADYANPKAIKSVGDLTVNNGIITVRTSQDGGEGLESKHILIINGGEIDAQTYDDAINAAKSIVINGGKIYCYSSGNDGIDSNGTLTVNGGIVISSGTNSPEEGFDCDRNTFKITGGILIGTGGSSSSPTASVCTQRSLLYGGSGVAGQIFHIQDTDGHDILTYMIPRPYTQMTLLFSSGTLTANTDYTIYTGGTVSGGSEFHGLYDGASYTGGTVANTFTTSSMVTTVGNTGGGPGGGGGGRPGGWN